MTARSNSSNEDEWCLVSDEEDRFSTTSFDEVEVEPEFPPKEQESQVCHAAAQTTDSVEDTNVTLLLVDTPTPKRSVAGYSREIRVALLSPTHQGWLSGLPPSYTASSSAVGARKRNVKLAFGGTEIRRRSFPERFRAAMPARHVSCEPPTFTEVTAFKKDQGTQTNLDQMATELEASNPAMLQAALERSLTLKNQLHAKSKDYEELWVLLMQTENAAQATKKKAQLDAMKIASQERRLALAKQQVTLTSEYQVNLKANMQELSRENAQLKRQHAALSGEDANLAVRSLDELEELETALARGMDKVRVALRAKYRAAVEKQREGELCAVCFAQPVSVVLLPCRHQVLCAACAVRVTTCPIDRQSIQDKVLTFGLNAYNSSQ